MYRYFVTAGGWFYTRLSSHVLVDKSRIQADIIYHMQQDAQEDFSVQHMQLLMLVYHYLDTETRKRVVRQCVSVLARVCKYERIGVYPGTVHLKG